MDITWLGKLFFKTRRDETRSDSKKCCAVFKPSASIETPLGNTVFHFLELDEEQRLWLIPDLDGYRRDAHIYSYSDIESFELLNDREAEAICRSLKIRIRLRGQVPAPIYIDFAVDNLSIDNPMYIMAMAKASECLSILERSSTE